jgi:hypothetical protein
MKPVTCFISYSKKDKCFVHTTLNPFLEKNNFHIVKSIQEANCIINFYDRSARANLALAVANSCIKPVINIIKDKDVARIQEIKNSTIIFDKKNPERFLETLEKEIEIASIQIFNEYPENEIIIGFSVGYEVDNYEREIAFTSEFIQFLKEATGCSDVKLVQTSKGCLVTILTIGVPLMLLVVEIIKKVAETKKTYAEIRKSNAETKKIYAETEKIKAETRKIDAEKFEKLLEKHQELGIKIQLDDRLLLEQNANGTITVNVPKKRRININ